LVKNWKSNRSLRSAVACRDSPRLFESVNLLCWAERLLSGFVYILEKQK